MWSLGRVSPLFHTIAVTYGILEQITLYFHEDCVILTALNFFKVSSTRKRSTSKSSMNAVPMVVDTSYSYSPVH